MQIYPNQLKQNLAKKLLPLYWLSGDEPLLLQQARDSIKNSAKNQGFLQHELFTIEPGFDWAGFQSISQNFGLFSEKTLIDLRNPKTKFDARANKILHGFCANLQEDQLLILSTPKLTNAEKNNQLYKLVDKIGATITIWPISAGDLPLWIKTQMTQANLSADAESIQLLAELTEGNLFSTQQAIEKLTLLYPQQKITVKQIADVTCDNARFTIFDLANQALQGNTKDISRTIRKLAQEKTEPTLVLWALVREIRQLIQLKQQILRGVSLQQATAKQWSSRKPLVTIALKRSKLSTLEDLLCQASHIDHCIKGFATGNIWNGLCQLALRLAGSSIALNPGCQA